MLTDVEIRHFHLFCGLGGGARGFNRGEARLGALSARFRCIGGVDSDPAALRDFGRLAGVPGTCLDLFDREQYRAFHGRAPGADWREATPEDVRRAAGGERPHIVFTSAPCKGFSGLLSETASRSAKYQALNRLTLRGVWLALEAWADDPPELILFENVPRIATRGRPLLDRIVACLRAYGYAVAETTHDCGQLGGLGQSRKRFLLVARHAAKVPGFLYELAKRPLKGVGEVLERLPLPGLARDGVGAGGAMHRMPALQWQTWVRLAFVDAGSDWRSLNRLAVAGGVLRDFAIAPGVDWHGGVLGVTPWGEPSGTVTSRGSPTTGSYAVADPRAQQLGDYRAYGIGGWDEPASTITSQRSPGQGRFAVADPRTGYGPNSHRNKLAVVPWSGRAGTVTGSDRVGSGALSVADPRVAGTPYNHVYRIVRWDETSPAVTSANGGTGAAVADPRPPAGEHVHQSKYRVTRGDEPAGAVIAASTTGNGAFAVADPRAGCLVDGRDYQTAGHYGVVPWAAPSRAVTASGQHDNGAWSVADPRPAEAGDERVAPEGVDGRDKPDHDGGGWALPGAREQLVCVIRALDGTWHRPFTTLELAALQGLVDPEEQLELDGLSDSAWRERIGNAVPPPAAEAVAGVMGRALLGAWAGEGFALSSEPIWVRDVAVALAVISNGANP